MPSQPRERGSSWESAKGVAGLGGMNQSVVVGEFNLSDIPHGVAATLMLTREDIETLAPGPTTQGAIAARIKYGIGTASAVALIDWNYGSSITVPSGAGGHVTVEALQRSLYVDNKTKGDMFKRVRLNALLVAGARSSLGKPTFTQVTLLPNPGDSVTVQVPNRAKQLQVNALTGSASDATVKLFNGGGSILFTVAGDPDLRTRGVEIPGATLTAIIQTAAGDANPITLSWLLDG